MRVQIWVSFHLRLCNDVFFWCRIPVFCVMMKNSLYNGEVCSAQLSFFWGSIFPYAASFLLYQGSLLISVLSWAGLIVNGSVAFLLPVTLVILAHHNLRRYGSGASKEASLTRKALDDLNRSNHEIRSKSDTLLYLTYLTLNVEITQQYPKKPIC